MPSADPGAPPSAAAPADVERWLTDLGIEPVDRAERDGITSWDLVLDGRRRFDLRVTVILDPSLAMICWAQLAPPISDMFRKSYRKLLRWNDEFPFAKFGLSEDERPLLAIELPISEVPAGRDGHGAETLGVALARIVGIADQLFDETAGWLWIGGRVPDQTGRTPRNEPFLARYADELRALAASEPEPGAAPEPGSRAADSEAIV